MLDDVSLWVDDIWRRGMRPDPSMTVSEWADRHRILPPSSAEPGPWSTARLPFLREIMDRLTVTDPTERVVVMKSAQVGGTETALNFVGYCIHQAPGNVMLVMPSTEMIRRNTATRIDPLVEHTPALRERVVPFRSRDSGNSATRKKFHGGELLMVGANSPLGLRSLPARFILLDEVDAFPIDADGEGDPVDLAMRAAITYRGRRKMLLISTPTTKGFSRIETAYLESDQRRYFVPCPHCDEPHVLHWQNVRWPEGERHRAHLVCPHCGCEITEAERHTIVKRGAWQPTAPGDGRTAGYHIGGLLSPFVSVAELALEHGLVCKDPPRHKTFKNVKLGELWEDESAAAPDTLAFLSRLEQWGELLPAGVVCLTAGVDTQDDRLEFEIVGWGRDEESWSIEHQVLWGDPAQPDVWAALDAELKRTFRHSRAVPDMPIRSVAIDSGGHRTQAVYSFASERQARRIWAIKGRGGQGIPVWPKRPSRAGRGNMPLYIVGVDAAKESIYQRLQISEAGPGHCHFPAGRDEEYFRQLTAERLMTRYVGGRPVREWHKAKGDRNEALDIRVYAYAALHGLVALGFRLNREAETLDDAPMRQAGDKAPLARPAFAGPASIKSRFLGG
jgi:phage terminase large subunit GpA-like protein